MVRKSLVAVLTASAVMAVGRTLLAQAGPATAVATAPAAASEARPADVPVTRVVLFSSGVGYFEHNGAVTGNVTADLQFETAQINDVLKSLVVYDKNGGTVRTITYPANDPVNRTLRSFQVNLSGDPSLAEVLKQIRGAAVTVAVADDTITGTILGVERKQKTVGTSADQKVIDTSVVNIITDTGIRSVSLDDVRKLEITDEKIRKEMGQALAALVQARDQSKKTVTVHFDGMGNRQVGMGYLVETPIWKTTYRLMLPDAASKANAELQAWAIVENQTDNDWKDVSLSLVGGRPISYIELLYQPMYVSRPVISPTVIGSLVPQTYDNGLLPGMTNGISVTSVPPSMNLNNGNGGFGGGGFGGAGGNMGGGAFFSNSGGVGNPASNAIAPAGGADTPADTFAQGVASIAEATKIGEMFHFNVDKVSLPRQQSSMIPIIAEGVKTDRVSIYSPSVSAKYAMRGLRLHNDTGKYLLGGPVTVMDATKDGRNYAGDAKIEDVPPGQSRLLSYALDQDMVIQVTKDEGDEALLTGSIVKGVLWLKYRSQVQRQYTLQNKGDADKTVVLEHPLTDGFDLKQPDKPLEKTDKVYRFEIKLAAKETKTFPVVLERTRSEQVALVNVADDPLMFYTRQAEIPAKVKEVLQTVATKRQAIADLAKKAQTRTQDRAQVMQDEGNIRDNIRVLPAGSKSQEDNITELSARDEDLKAANKDIKDLQAQLETARTDLAKYLESTTIE